MKKTAGIIALTGAAVLMVTLLTGCFNSVKVSGIRSFQYRFTTGNAIWSNVRYELQAKNSIYMAIVKPDNVPDEQALIFEVDQKFEEDLRAILEKYEVGKWNGFNKSNRNVMDGNSFSLDIYMDNGEISAHGYMKWPDGYADFKEEVIALFDNAMAKIK